MRDSKIKNIRYFDKLAKNNNGVKYLLIRQDVFDRIVDAKGMKTQDSEETVYAFLTMILKKNRFKNFCVDKGTQFAGDFKKFCEAEGSQVYSTVSETEAALAERTKRSLKKILDHYMEHYGYKYNHKLSQFVTTLISSKNCSIDLIPKTIKKSDFLSVLYSRPLRESKEPNFKIGDRLRISEYD